MTILYRAWKNEVTVTREGAFWGLARRDSPEVAMVGRQAQAIAAARRFLEDNGGGLLIVNNRRGAVREVFEVPPAPTPFAVATSPVPEQSDGTLPLASVG